MNTDPDETKAQGGTDETSSQAPENSDQPDPIPCTDEESGSGLVQDAEGDQAALEPNELIECATLADVPEIVKSTRWLWPKWLPRGHVSLLVGAPGDGKTTVALDILARLLNGDELPDDRPPEQIDLVMWVDTEGTQAVLATRAEVMGVPMDKVIFPTEKAVEDLRLDSKEHWIRFAHAAKVRHPALIVVDTLRGAYSGNENSSHEAGKLMKALQILARDTGAAILAIHHTRKLSELAGDAMVTLDRVRGSSAITANARCVWVIEDFGTSQADAKRLRVEKSNLSDKPAPIGFTVDNVGVKWTDPPAEPKIEQAIVTAMNFLGDVLKGGPRPPNEIEQDATASEISMATLRRAKKRLRVRSTKSAGPTGQWTWSLPPQEKEVA